MAVGGVPLVVLCRCKFSVAIHRCAKDVVIAKEYGDDASNSESEFEAGFTVRGCCDAASQYEEPGPTAEVVLDMKRR